MSVLLTRGTRLSQPQGPVEVDWANPIARGLFSSFYASERKPNTTVNGTYTTNADGTVVRGSGMNYPVSYPATKNIGTGDYTFLVVHRPYTASSIGSTAVTMSDQASNVWIGDASGSGAHQCGGTRVSSGFLTSAGKLSTHVGTRRSGVIRAYTNGQTGGATASSSSSVNITSICIGSYTGLGYAFFSDYAASLVWDRALSAAEIASISANPWQLFKPVQRRVWFDASAGGGSTAYTLTADVGAYSLSGVDAGVIASRRLTADVGSYGLTGQEATLTYTPASGAYTLTADVGTYNLSGVDAATIAARRVTADVGSYGLTGQDAAFVLARRLTADYGAYSLTGQDATLTATGAIAYTLAAEYGLYSVAGQNAELIAPSGIVDTHDGFWIREYRKMFEYGKKKPTIAEVVDEVVKQDPIAAIEAVKPAVAAKIKLPDNNSELVAKIQQSANLQKAIASALISKAQAQKAIDDDEQDIEDILMLI